MSDKIIKGYYKAANGAYFSDKDAVKYGAEIEKIMGANPGVSLISDMVLDAAENKDSALHDYFEWDDSVCARRYRLKQAEEMICHLRYVVVTEGKEISQRAFINVTVEENDEEEEFVPVRKLMNSPDMKDKALKKAMKELEKWFLKYSYLHELDVVFRAVKSINAHRG